MLDRETLSERIGYNMNAARFPKEEVTPVIVPTAQVTNTEWNNVMKIAADTSTRLYGGTTYEYADVKASAAQTLVDYRIYFEGYILSGGAVTRLMAFRVSAGDKFKLSGLKNDSTNASLCWAVYNEYMTLATDGTTKAALEAAFLTGSADYTPGQTDVEETLIMPTGAAMLVISAPHTGDESTVEKYSEVEVGGIDTQVTNHETRLTAMQSSVTSLIVSMTAAENDIDDLQESTDDHESRLTDAEDTVAELDATVNGGEYDTYESIKSSGTTYPQLRLYGDGQGGGGNVLSGDTTVKLMRFAVTAGDKIRMTGLKNSETNPTLCWAIYDTFITPATDSATTAALEAAMLTCDSSVENGRSGVSASLTMPTGAAMLLISIPASSDSSTIEKNVINSESGLVPQVAQHTTQITSLQSATADLPTMRTNISTLSTNVTKQANSIALLQNCVAVDVKALLTTTPNGYGVINGFGRITNDGKIVRDSSDVCTTYIIRLSAFTDKKFSATGLANNPNNASLCWATYNIPESAVDFNSLFNSPYYLDWSSYLISAYSDTSYATGRTGQSVELIDLTGTGATYLVFSTLTASASACSVRNYNTTLLTDLQEKAEKTDGLVVIKNALGRPSQWNARTSITSDNITGTMTLGEDYATINIVSSSAVEGQHGLWFGFEGHNVVEGHKYMMILKYRNRGYSWGAAYYNSHITWSNDTYIRNSLVDDSDNNVWKYDVVNQYFTAPSSGDLWIDFMVYVNGTNTGAETLADFDMIPMMIDITDADLTADQLIAIMEKAGVFYDTLVLANWAINPLKSITDEYMICLGDSTTGMLMWQPELARIKGWTFDGRTNGGMEFNGVDSPYTAMGIGGTAVEPIIYGTGAAGAGYSQYIRARYAHLYNPTVIFVMSSYNGAHNGAHWGNNASYPTQPDDYGLADLIASGMNTDTGTYNGTYMGEEVDLTSDASAEVPSFAASYFGMIYRLVVDNPTARIILITLMNDFEPTNSEYLDLKNAVIKKAGEVFHLQVIDANCCGINRTNRLTTRYDEGGVHFNEAGGLMLAKYIASQV